MLATVWTARAERSGQGAGIRPSALLACRLLAVTGVALLTANCGSTTATKPGRAGNKYGVAASPKVIPDGQPIPKGGGRDMVGKPYVVGERTYVPHAGKGYVREGEASWYGTAFHGRLTANGEVFDKESVAAAHPTLPLPSYVRVTNVANHRSMIVRVNDRGPYERGRLIDLSERAAQALEFHRAGTTKVRVEYVGKASLGGSDDRKLLATLRTDGEPASTGRGPVMLAALDERASKPNLPPLAFRPQQPKPVPTGEGVDDADEVAPAPVVLASRNIGSRPPVDEMDAPEVTPAPTSGPRVAAARPTELVVPKAAPVHVADRPAAKGDRLAGINPAASAKGDRLVVDRPGTQRPAAKPDRSLDLVTIPGAGRASPPVMARLAPELPPGRPKLAQLSAETGHKSAEKPRTETRPSAERQRPPRYQTALDD
jgi:rare lipoprotein A